MLEVSNSSKSSEECRIQRTALVFFRLYISVNETMLNHRVRCKCCSERVPTVQLYKQGSYKMCNNNYRTYECFEEFLLRIKTDRVR